MANHTLAGRTLRKAFLHDLHCIMQIEHRHSMPNVEHLHEADGKREAVVFNFEIGYEYKRIHAQSTIEEVYEYTHLVRKLRSMQNAKHTCLSEFFLEDLCRELFEDKRVAYVKADMKRLNIIPEGAIGVGVELWRDPATGGIAGDA